MFIFYLGIDFVIVNSNSNYGGNYEIFIYLGFCFFLVGLKINL